MVHNSKPASRKAEHGAAVAAAILAAVGTHALVAWLGGVQPLATFALGERPIRPPVALCLMLFAAALRWRNRRGARLALAATIAPIVGAGVATAAMTASAALAFAAAAAALPLLEHPGRRAGAACTALLLFTGVVGLASLIARLYGVAPGSSGANDVLMALPTTLATLLLAVGGQLARPTRGLVGLALRDDAAGFLVGRLLPPAIVVPIALDFLRLLGQRAGWYGTELGLALFATSNVIVFAALVALAARVVVRHDHYCFSKDIGVEHEAHEELVRAREAAEAGLRARSDFLARMSHEIRTPMNAVIGMTRLALETELAPEQREYLETVESSARGLLEIIDDVLDFAKIDAQRLHLEQTPFELRECLGIAVRGLAQRAHGKALELLVDVAAEVPDRVVGDPLRLAQIVVNLVGNAVKFTPFGEIVVSARVRERDAGAVLLELAVRDTGIGIAADKQRRIFEAFSQADEATTREYGGTGLGLAISTRLVHMMGGEIGVDSAPERGSTFWFTTRLSLAPPVETMTEDTLPSLRDLPVLIVDDHARGRRILVEQLAGWGLAAEGATSAEAPLTLRRAAEAGRPHELLIVDATATFAGDEVAAPTIVLTRAAGGSEPRRAAARLLKPPTPQTLRDTLRAVLAGRSSRRGAAAPERAARRALAILVAEDNPINAKLASVVLRKAGHEIVTVDSGAAALAALAARSFDVVLMDVQMPEMDGLETTRAIRAREARRGDRRIPIIALTAQAMKGDRERCLAAGMDGYVAKPFDASTLFAELDARVPPAAAPAAPPPAATAIVHDELVRRAGGDLELVRDIAALFADDAPNSLAALREAVAGGDPTAIARAAHKLKGALLNVAARPAAQAALALEEAGRHGQVDGAGAALVRLEGEVQAAIAALSAVAHAAPRAA